MIKICDNFLPSGLYAKLARLASDENLPYIEHVKGNGRYVADVYGFSDNGDIEWLSDARKEIYEIIERKLNVVVKIGNTWFYRRRSEPVNPHLDGMTKLQLLVYLGQNSKYSVDSGTAFFDDTGECVDMKVRNVPNRAVLFPSTTMHSALPGKVNSEYSFRFTLNTFIREYELTNSFLGDY